MNLLKLFGVRKMTKEERAAYLATLFPADKGFNTYFHRVGIAYRIAEFAFLFLFLGFLVISAMGNLSGINYTNAEYLFRNFGGTLEANRAANTELIYNPDTGMAFASGGKGFSVCGETGVTVFSATGRISCTEVMELRRPCICAAGKYTLVYESNGYHYYVFGPSLIHSEQTKTPIRGASLAENGNYALISAADGYTSCVTVYDSDFSPVNRYLKNAYVVSAELDESGERLVITALQTDADGSYLTEITEYTVGKNEADTKRSCNGIFPLSSFLSGGHSYTVDAENLTRYENGKSTVLNFAGGTVEQICRSEGAACVLLSSRNSGGELFFRVVAADADGQTRDTGNIPAAFCRIAQSGNRIFLLTDAGLRIFENGELSEAKNLRKPYDRDTRILAYSKEKIYLAGKSAAYLLEVN